MMMELFQKTHIRSKSNEYAKAVRGKYYWTGHDRKYFIPLLDSTGKSIFVVLSARLAQLKTTHLEDGFHTGVKAALIDNQDTL